MHIEQVIIELLHMFYFYNLCNILDARDKICMSDDGEQAKGV